MLARSVVANLEKTLQGETVVDSNSFSTLTKRYFENYYIPLSDRQQVYGSARHWLMTSLK
jgi:hypothetical protein